MRKGLRANTAILRLATPALLGFALLCVWSPAAPGDPSPDVRAAAGDGGAYVLQRGDQLEIRVFNISNLDQTVTIRPDGKISILLLDDVQAAGLTAAKLDEVITARYVAFYRDPQVTINVKSFSDQKVYVAGEVTNPGLLALTGEMTAMRALLQVGGMKSTAKASSVLLLRDGGKGTTLVTTLDMKRILKGAQGDVPLKPFDVVYVPKSRITRVNEFVDRYIRQSMPVTTNFGFSYLLNGTIVGSTQ